MDWRRLFDRRPSDSEIDEEIRAHLQMATHDQIERGESPQRARRAARLELGSPRTIQEETRSVWKWAALETLTQDLKYAFRRIRHRPGFTAVAVLTLAFGMGVNATIFSLISSLFLRPLPVKDAERLVVVLRQRPNADFVGGVSWLDYEDYRDGIKQFSDVLALAFRPAHLSVGGRDADRTWIEAVSSNYFSMLGVVPSSGRFFLPEEGERPGADAVVVLGHDYWQTRLAADPSVVGKKAIINGRAHTVIGIAPEAFSSVQWSMAPGAFVLASMMPDLFPGSASVLERRKSGAFKVMAQLRPGVAEAEASSAVGMMAQRLAEQYRPDERDTRTFVRAERLTRPEPSFSNVMPFVLAVFFVLATLVLFIACANVANLMFSQAVGRQHEIVIRSAIGADRRRLIRQLLTESILLAVIAGAVGLLLARGIGLLLAHLSTLTGDVPVRPDERWDWFPVLSTMLVSLVVGVVTGLFPAVRGTRVDLASALQGSSRQGRERHLFRSTLIFGQISVAVVVLACAGLFGRSLLKLSEFDLGFRPDRLLMASVDLGLQGYDKQRGLRLLDQLIARVRELPGVESAAIGSNVPFDTDMATRQVISLGEAGDAVHDGGDFRVGVNRVDAAYFEALRMPLLLGRGVAEQDAPLSPRVAVVNEAFAERLWPGQAAVGRRFRWKSDREPIEVIGVTPTGKYFTLGEAARPYVYTPMAQDYSAPITIHIRTATDDPIALVPVLREVIRDLDPALPVYSIRTMKEHLHSSVFAFLPLRLGAVMAGTQGAIAALLAVMGVYGVVAFSVARRTRDIGIRVALGAQRLDVLRLVSRSALRPALVGLASGLALTLALARFLSALLYGLDPVNLQVFAGVIAFILGVSLLACWLPARKALRIEPMSALHYD